LIGEKMGSFTYDIYLATKLNQREVYGRELIRIAKERDDIVVLTGDLAKSTKIDEFFETFPERSFNFGIAEQNMMGAAAGFAISGMIPVVSTLAVFACLRVCEQIRTDIAYPNLKVIIVATHAGVSFGQAGPTHHCTEDLGIMRTMANMCVVAPADSIETAKALISAIDRPGPVYIRIGRGFEPLVYENSDYKYRIGEAITIREGKDFTVIACGNTVSAAKTAADMLAKEGIDVRIINMHTIKPIDKEVILKSANETKFIITVEEHNIIGGLGSAVAEVLAEQGIGIKLHRLGLPDTYSVIGPAEELYHKYLIDADGIVKVARERWFKQ